MILDLYNDQIEADMEFISWNKTFAIIQLCTLGFIFVTKAIIEGCWQICAFTENTITQLASRRHAIQVKPAIHRVKWDRYKAGKGHSVE